VRYLSVCSGIEAATVAWDHWGFEPAGFSEIDPFCCALLETYFPDVPNLGDMTKYREWPDACFEILVGGTPCQSFSVAGLRKGLDDPRGNLALVFVGLLERYHPRWFVWENVPGVLSSSGGRDFGVFLGALAEIGYGFAWRILDAQFFGVPQRRRRVFVVGHPRDWRGPAAVLFERESLRRDPPSRRKAQEDVAGTLAVRTRGGGGLGTDFDLAGGVVGTPAASGAGTARPAGNANETDLCIVTHPLRGEGFDASEDGTGRGTPLVGVSHDPACTLTARERKGPLPEADLPTVVVVNARQNPIVSTQAQALDRQGNSQAIIGQCHGSSVGRMGTFHGRNVSNGVPFLEDHAAVRRLTPRECERLQGFPDDWTAITFYGKPASDGQRYKAIGNSMAVPCMRWIGRRIQIVDTLLGR